MSGSNLSRINTNIAALNALNALNNVNTQLSMHQLRLATGKKINSAADDAAGFTIASKLKVQSDGMGTALDNIGTAKNLMTVAEGHLTNIQDILAKMKTKAQEAATDTLGADERTAIFNELAQYNDQINAEVAQAKWAGVDILSTNKNFQIGVGTTASDSLSFNVAGAVTSLATTNAVPTFDSVGLAVMATSVNSGVAVQAASSIAAAGTMAITAGVGAISATVAVVTATAGQMAFTNINATSSSVGTTSSLSTSLSELATGNYTLKITTTGTSSTPVVSIQLLDKDSNAVSIDADGVIGGSTSTTLSFTMTSTMALDPTSINLGNGLTVDLGVITTSAAASGTIALSYTKSVAAAATAVVSRTSNLSTSLTELATGNYSLVVSSSGATGTLKLLDANGAAVSIDANGDISDTTNATSLSFTITGTSSIAATTLNLGNGLMVNLGAMSTGTAAAATISVAYTHTQAYVATSVSPSRGNDVTDQTGAQAFMAKIDTAITTVSSALSYIGTQYNRLTFQETSMTVAQTNTQAAYSQIVDADMASEQLQSTKLQILQQTATAMLAQANVAPQTLLTLFK